MVKMKISLMGFVYTVVRVLKPCESFCLNPSISRENCQKLTFLRCSWKFYHRVTYMAPSSGHISLNLNMPFKFILRRFEVVFWCLEWECCTFWKIDGNSFKSTNTILCCPTLAKGSKWHTIQIWVIDVFIIHIMSSSSTPNFMQKHSSY